MSSEDNEKFFTEWEETFDSFDQMGLHENLLRGIYAYGEPRPLQQGVGAVYQRPCNRPGALDAPQEAAAGCNPHTAAAAAVAGCMGPRAAARLAGCMLGAASIPKAAPQRSCLSITPASHGSSSA
jgi:hypothetical protein